MGKPVTGKCSHKDYKCDTCGNVSSQGTNHWGAIYIRCPGCGWKHPMEIQIHRCVDPCPDTHNLPEEWKVLTLGDLCEIEGGQL